MITHLKIFATLILLQLWTEGVALSQENIEDTQKKPASANAEFMSQYFDNNKLSEDYSTNIPQGYRHFMGNYVNQKIFDGFIYYVEGASLKRFPLSSWGLAINKERENLLETIYDFGESEKVKVIDYGFSQQQKLLYVFIASPTDQRIIKLNFSDEKKPSTVPGE